MSKATESIAIIIPTYNSGETLETCLKSVARQPYPSYELIVIDSFSTDTTVRVAKEFAARVFMLKALPSRKKNVGLMKSSSHYILFLDSDEALGRDTIQNCIDLCRKGADFVCFDFTFVGERFWSSSSALLRNSLKHALEKMAADHPIPRFFKRETLLSVGPYDESLLLGEDWELYHRMKKSDAKEALSKPKIYHIEPSSINKMVKKEVRYGLSEGRLKRQGILPWKRPALMFTAKGIMFDGSHANRLKIGALFLLFIRSFARAMGMISSKLVGDE